MELFTVIVTCWYVTDRPVCSVGNPYYTCSRTSLLSVSAETETFLVEVRISAHFLHESSQNIALNSTTAGSFAHSSRRWTSFSGGKFCPSHRHLSISLDPGLRLSSFLSSFGKYSIWSYPHICTCFFFVIFFLGVSI